jgi:hypothetical protein
MSQLPAGLRAAAALIRPSASGSDRAPSNGLSAEAQGRAPGVQMRSMSGMPCVRRARRRVSGRRRRLGRAAGIKICIAIATPRLMTIRRRW